MIIWSIITSIFWAVIVAVVLWVLCIFSGRMVNSMYSAGVAQHVICFLVAIPTIILLVVFFLCNKANRTVERVDEGIAIALETNARFMEQLSGQINRAASTADTDELTEYIAENVSESILSEYPILKRYLDIDKFLENADLKDKLSDVSGNLSNADKLQLVIQAAVSSFTDGIRSKIKSVRRKMLIYVVILQLVSFGAVFYSASKYRSPSTYNYESNNFY